MNLFHYLLLFLFPILGVNLYATIGDLNWLMRATQILFILGVFTVYITQNKKPGFNALCFFMFFFLAQVAGLLFQAGNLSLLLLFCYIGGYFGLSREAFQNTQRQTASKTILVYFLLLIAVNGYLLLTHVIELKSYMSSNLEFGVYAIYYFNLLILGVFGLIYYLNSYSKKSVYFITLVLAFIFADVFRDAAHFYLKDSAVLITGNLLWFTGLIFCLFFFLTPERKLRLMNLV
ncbi:hypothetical protein SAMN05660776_1026 [Salegentibacter holothuriorum]|uniref:YhhN-like protein n=2 Tax=Salegentibacter holothuriorum TaxID=241145 RepID=A0A1T5B088_9FLAO|nr:hypothetical protein SAMN05660776_1026 [Salegentibacter holothuriorum]